LKKQQNADRDDPRYLGSKRINASLQTVGMRAAGQIETLLGLTNHTQFNLPEASQ
jgi:hypothetical protein